MWLPTGYAVRETVAHSESALTSARSGSLKRLKCARCRAAIERIAAAARRNVGQVRGEAGPMDRRQTAGDSHRSTAGIGASGRHRPAPRETAGAVPLAPDTSRSLAARSRRSNTSGPSSRRTEMRRDSERHRQGEAGQPERTRRRRSPPARHTPWCFSDLFAVPTPTEFLRQALSILSAAARSVSSPSGWRIRVGAESVRPAGPLRPPGECEPAMSPTGPAPGGSRVPGSGAFGSPGSPGRTSPCC